MGIDDRDYTKNRGKDPGKDWYNPKEFRGKERIKTWYPSPGRNQQTREEVKKEIEKEEGRENFNFDAEAIAKPAIPVPPRGWIDTGSGYESRVRPWLKHLFVWLLVGLAIHKAVEFNQKRIAWKEQERQTAMWQEQQRQQEARARAERAYPSPYTRQYPPAQRAYPEPRSVPFQAPARPPSVIIRNGVTVLEASRDGHYFISGTVNGFPVVFMVDTGATYVSINEDTAARAGISRCSKTTFSTANGNALGCKAIVPMIEFGGYAITNVEVTIAPGLQDRALLGMNVLRLFQMKQQGNQLSLAPAS